MGRIDLYEWLAGKLLVKSAMLRVKRGSVDDIHEVRHIGTALHAGASDFCKPDDCRLDRDGLMAWYERRAAEYRKWPITPDRGGGVPGDNFPL